MRLSTRFLVVCGCVLLLALAWYVRQSSLAKVRAHNWVPLSQGIQIKPGTVLDTQIQTDRDDWYEIAVDVERKLEFQRINCLLGNETLLFAEKCPNLESLVAMTWSVREESGRGPVASGSSKSKSGSYWGSTIGRTIGRFQASSGRTYFLHVESAVDGGELNSANPKIRVAINPKTFKNVVANTQIAVLLSNLCALVGGLILLGVFLVALYQKLKPKLMEWRVSPR